MNEKIVTAVLAAGLLLSVAVLADQLDQLAIEGPLSTVFQHVIFIVPLCDFN
ncbi:MAG: hypothetical protein ABSE45_03045 [Candidatus Acidiferrales bacterium]|jgi:hypothetical protein